VRGEVKGDKRLQGRGLIERGKWVQDETYSTPIGEVDLVLCNAPEPVPTRTMTNTPEFRHWCSKFHLTNALN